MPAMFWTRRVAAVLAISLVLGGVQTGAHAATVDNESRARAFVTAVGADNASRAVALVAPTLRFWTDSNPSVTYRGRARYDFLASGFGDNCVLAVVGRAVVKRSIRTVALLVETRADSHHGCGDGQRGVRVTFTMAFTKTGKIRSLHLADA
jgi:hypothetical protein